MYRPPFHQVGEGELARGVEVVDQLGLCGEAAHVVARLVVLVDLVDQHLLDGMLELDLLATLEGDHVEPAPTGTERDLDLGALFVREAVDAFDSDDGFREVANPITLVIDVVVMPNERTGFITFDLREICSEAPSVTVALERLGEHELPE